MTRRCPCFLHYHPPRPWWHLTCACECDHEDEKFCPDCCAGIESSEHHEKCVAPLDQIEGGV